MERLCIPAPLPGGSPWLVYSHEHGTSQRMQTFTTICPSDNNKTTSYLKEIPELQSNYVQASSFGWLLLQDYGFNLQFCLWNPVTLESISLPLLEQLVHIDVGITVCALTISDIDDDDFTVFVFCEHIVFFCRPLSSDRNPRWRSQNIKIGGRRASVRFATTCSNGGLIYASALVTDHNGRALGETLITVKHDGTPSDNSHSISIASLEVQIPQVIDPKSFVTTATFHMLESCGQIYYVQLSLNYLFRINAVEIWELDLERKTWVEVKSLNNRAFFLGNAFCTWCCPTIIDHQIEPNSVYISQNFDHTLDNIVYKYSLQHRSLTVYFPCPDMQSTWIPPFWFIPNSRSLKRTEPKKAIHILHQNDADIVEYPNKLLLPKQQNETTDQNILKRLPLDVIELISKFLYCFDYFHFRATCKTFRSMLPHGRWFQGKRNYNSSLPFFVSLSSNEGWLKLVDSFRNESCYIAIPKSPFSIDYCKDGWLILYCGGEFFQFFNLFTRTWGNLPPHEDIMGTIMSIGFSTCLASSDCVIVRMIRCPLSAIKYMHSGDKDWKSFELEEEDEEEEEEEGGEQNSRFKPGTCSPVYCNGRFNFLDLKGCLGAFELVGEKPTWQVYGRPKTRDTESHTFHLVECDGNLFSVFIGKFGKWIKVFMFDDDKKVWIRVKSLGNKVFFISSQSSISTVAQEVGTGNRIYFPRIHDKGFIFYSLETRKFHVLGTDVVMDCFCPSQEPFQCCWA